jgi:hypothetical protein
MWNCAGRAERRERVDRRESGKVGNMNQWKNISVI